mmetsp:Transcript_28780/g.59064  ORF Transcript_28780/g.59064 Transcript_28780/m.59064 type:complete len:80 (-) Transcript_28780:32-271(-)
MTDADSMPTSPTSVCSPFKQRASMSPTRTSSLSEEKHRLLSPSMISQPELHESLIPGLLLTEMQRCWHLKEQTHWFQLS